MATGLEKVSFHSDLKEEQCQRMFKLYTTALIVLASEVMLKILQARLQQYVNRELSDVQAGFRIGFLGSSAGKESAFNAGDPGLIPGLGRSTEGIGYPLQCSWASLVSQR